MRYRMIAIDLDGTLLDGEGGVSAANRAAVQRAVDAGVLVVPCTGRSWVESRRVLEQVETFCDGKPGVFATGAMVHEAGSGKVLHRTCLAVEVIEQLVTQLGRSGEAILLFRDRDLVGHDYLIIGDRDIDDNTRWWFSVNELKWRTMATPTPADFEHSVRLQIVGTADRTLPLHEAVVAAMPELIYAHCFEAVQMPEPTENIYILEVFAAGVDKWAGLKWVAESHGIDAAHVAAIGDEVNDLHMLEAAGCSIAMGNAVPAAKQAARHVTEANSADGVARAIDRLLDGQW